MLFEHASYAFPTEWVVLLDLALTLLAAGLLAGLPGFGRRVSRAVWRGLDALGRGPRRTAVALSLAGGLGTAALLAALGPPVPRIPDEKSYLLAADIYAHGQWAYPSHHDRAHFVTTHVLHEPVYTSKYPPAQGLVLALGLRLGHPAVGLALSSALLALAIGWALAPALPPPWPLVGGLVAVLRFGVGGYFNQSYWGGSVAVIGGALVLGGVLRLIHRPRAGAAAWLVLGLLALAHSRPVEGLPMAAVAGIAVLVGWRRRGLGGRVPAAPVAVLVAGGLAVVATVALHNVAVTGRPLLFPHQLHARQFPEYLHWVWQNGPGWMLAAPLDWARKCALTVYFFLGTALVALPLAASRALALRPAARIAAALAAAVLLALLPIRPYHAHYAAPLAAPLVLLGTLGLRAGATSRIGGRRLGSRLAIAVLAIHAAGFAFQVPAHRADAADWSQQRAAIERQLLREPGRDLVLVDYPEGRVNSWVWNDADIDASEIIWAESIGAAADRALIDRHAGRRAWRLSAGAAPRLVPVEESPTPGRGAG